MWYKYSMIESFVFHPYRRMGLAFHILAIVLMLMIGIWGLWQAANADIGPVFVLYMVPIILALIILPILAYRFYALYGAYYRLERDGIYLRWGLRIEQLPMDVIDWVHPADDLEPPVPLPLLRWPGAVLGNRKMPGKGRVEFVASTTRDMLIIATPRIAYGISPADRFGLLQAYQQLIELGSTAPLPPKSVYPSFLLARVWSSRWARVLILAGIIINLLLLAFVLFSVPALGQVYLGFRPGGAPADLVPAIRLLLLPVLSFSFYFVDLFLGFFFYRNDSSHDYAYLLWMFGVISPVLFTVGVYLILQS